MKLSGKGYNRIVIKIGASLLYKEAGKLNFSVLKDIAEQIACLVKEKKEVVVVSSGAIALGMSILRLQSRPKDLSCLQAAAAIGQHELMQVYQGFFKERQLNCAQILLTWDDFVDRKRYLNGKNTLLTLLKLDTVPIINENDTVATDEIKFGDNDKLCALVAGLISADILIILSDVDGLLDKDKKTIIRVIDEITPQIKALACGTNKDTCVGGMVTKIEAAKIAIDSGIPCVIANGRRKDIIFSVIEETEKYGTLFQSKKFLAERERWIAFGTKTKGKITVDDGAKLALMNKKSLLSVGVTAIEGNFDLGDIVSVQDIKGNEFARGKVNTSSRQLDKVKGNRFEKEVIHRDNIVIL